MDPKLASIRLLSTNLGLGKLIDCQPLDNQSKEDFRWTSSLMSKVYWNSSYYHDSKIVEDLAKSVRLEFYKSMGELKLENTEETKYFLDKLYLALKLQGEKNPLSLQEIKVAERLIYYWAREIISIQSYRDFHQPISIQQNSQTFFPILTFDL